MSAEFQGVYKRRGKLEHSTQGVGTAAHGSQPGCEHGSHNIDVWGKGWVVCSREKAVIRGRPARHEGNHERHEGNHERVKYVHRRAGSAGLDGV